MCSSSFPTLRWNVESKQRVLYWEILFQRHWRWQVPSRCRYARCPDFYLLKNLTCASSVLFLWIIIGPMINGSPSMYVTFVVRNETKKSPISKVVSYTNIPSSNSLNIFSWCSVKWMIHNVSSVKLTSLIPYVPTFIMTKILFHLCNVAPLYLLVWQMVLSGSYSRFHMGFCEHTAWTLQYSNRVVSNRDEQCFFSCVLAQYERQTVASLVTLNPDDVVTGYLVVIPLVTMHQTHHTGWCRLIPLAQRASHKTLSSLLLMQGVRKPSCYPSTTQGFPLLQWKSTFPSEWFKRSYWMLFVELCAFGVSFFNPQCNV